MTISIEQGRFPQLSARVLPIREAVFVIEQSVPVELERDDRDPDCQHLLILDQATPVATGRIDLNHGGKLGRIAVVKDRRGEGLGKLVVNQLEQIAIQHGLDSVWMHAQTDMIGFYEQLGYRATGSEFEEAGIMHRKMVKLLKKSTS